MPINDPKTPDNASVYDEQHPEQDPAEGSRDVIDNDLEEDSGKTPTESESGRSSDGNN